MVQILLINFCFVFVVASMIIIQTLVYAAEINEIDGELMDILIDNKSELGRLKQYALNSMVHHNITHDSVHIQNKEQFNLSIRSISQTLVVSKLHQLNLGITA